MADWHHARPAVALERVEQVAGDQLFYRLLKPQPNGRTELRLTPLELIDRLAALIRPPSSRSGSDSSSPMRTTKWATAPWLTTSECAARV